MSHNEQAAEAVNKIRALRTLTATTGTKTNRTVNAILQSLPSEVLTLVAVQLQQNPK